MTDMTDSDYVPKRVQITTHISLESRTLLARAKDETGKSLGRLIDDAIQEHLASYRRD